jgi:hypothetical protein
MVIGWYNGFTIGVSLLILGEPLRFEYAGGIQVMRNIFILPKQILVPILLLLVSGSSVRAATSVCPDYDLDDDCIVTLFDFALFSSQWLSEEIFCAVDFEDCDDLYGNGCETDVANDVNNCGGCGIACQSQNATPDCVASLCEFDCLVGFDDCDEDPNTGCETALNTLTDCGTCGSPCVLANAQASCATGSCEVDTCAVGFENCDGSVANGCEIDLNTSVSHCGSCNNACFLPNAVEQCVSGTCGIQSCDGAWSDCDASTANGCEVDTASDLNNCGGCGLVCQGANATPLCIASACDNICDTGFEDCDGSASNGCETSLNTISNCGACNNSCNLPNAIETCAGGTCQVQSCFGGWGNCDGNPANGCETPLNTVSDCGNCNNSCNLPNAIEICSGGTCQVQSCFNGWADCDGNPFNGCEFNLKQSASCGAATFLGNLSADTGCKSGPTFNDKGQRYVRITAREDDVNPFVANDLSFEARLISPAGMDYDLWLYDGCGNQVDFSVVRGSGLDVVNFNWNDNTGSDDSKTLYIEIRHFSGSNCSNWTLQTFGGC